MNIDEARRHLSDGGCLKVVFEDGAHFIVRPVAFFEGTPLENNPLRLKAIITTETGTTGPTISIKGIDRYLDQPDVVSVGVYEPQAINDEP